MFVSQERMEDMNEIIKEIEAGCQLPDRGQRIANPSSFFLVIFGDSELAGTARKLRESKIRTRRVESKGNPCEDGQKMNTPQEHRIGHPLLYKMALLLKLLLEFLKRV
jgi:hypothetical protein